MIYCSLNNFEQKHKDNTQAKVIFFDYPELRYFKSLSESIKQSALPEFLDFLELHFTQVGKDGKLFENTSKALSATILPESYSSFPSGYKIISFYVDAETLLERAYVLRRQGWRDTENLYQRMISSSKILSIRKYLKSKKRVFVNNIIATLSDSTKILDGKGNTVDPASKTTNESVVIQLPNVFNSIGLIDGQHRVFSYYKGNPDDKEIKNLRKKQNLLVTGIIYPSHVAFKQREIFEANLFLEINNNQTNAKSELKQSINRIIKPFSDESIAFSIMNRLGTGSGPLAGHVVRHWFDQDKLKTTSVVSYGLKPLAKTSGDDSLFSAWEHPEKNEMIANERQDLLAEYIVFCANHIDSLLLSFKLALPSDAWTAKRENKNRIITTTFINSMLICLRIIIKNKHSRDIDNYKLCLKGIDITDFEGYHSSQYAKLAEKLYDKFFSSLPKSK